MIFVEWNSIKNFALTISINLSTHIFCMNQLSFVSFDLISFFHFSFFLVFWLLSRLGSDKILTLMKLPKQCSELQSKRIFEIMFWLAGKEWQALIDSKRIKIQTGIHYVVVYAHFKKRKKTRSQKHAIAE